jgi:carbamoyltransferase
MKTLGISCFYHDSAAALIVDGAVVAAAEEERYSRLKHDARFPTGAIRDVLRIGKVDPAEVDVVAFYEKPLAKFERMMSFGLAHDIDGSHFETRLATFLEEQATLASRLRELGIMAPIEHCEHHLSHLASAYYMSGDADAALLSVDGVGEWTTTAIGIGRGRDIEIIEELGYPHSLGLFYSAFTAYLGFKVNNDEYKVMGMTAYGKPIYIERLAEVLKLHPDGRYELGMQAFDFHRTQTRMHSQWLVDQFGPPRKTESEISQHHYDLAASVQELTCRCMLGLARRAKQLSGGVRTLCLSGGVALNCLANQRIVESGEFDRVVIQPAAGDGGTALGAAMWAAARREPLAISPQPEYSSCLGPEFTEAEIESALRDAGANYTRLDEATLPDTVAQLLAEERIIAFFQGRMEFGPRALGCRSILASPLRAEMKDVINRRIKFRESFRPFAPVSPEDRAGEIFELKAPMPYMLVTCNVKPEMRDKVPAITHADGTARLQTVRRHHNPRYHDIIQAFGKRTGVPVLINTSFNVNGEPIVRTPAEAYRCFTLTDIDVLIIGPFMVERLW